MRATRRCTRRERTISAAWGALAKESKQTWLVGHDEQALQTAIAPNPPAAAAARRGARDGGATVNVERPASPDSCTYSRDPWAR